MCHDTLFESAVTVCIILNTVFLAIEHHGMSAELKHVLEIGELGQFLSIEQLQSFKECPCSNTHWWPHFTFFFRQQSFYYIFCNWSRAQITSIVQGILPKWMEYFWPNNCCSLVSGPVSRKYQWYFSSARNASGKILKLFLFTMTWIFYYYLNSRTGF